MRGRERLRRPAIWFWGFTTGMTIACGLSAVAYFVVSSAQPALGLLSACAALGLAVWPSLHFARYVSRGPRLRTDPPPQRERQERPP